MFNLKSYYLIILLSLFINNTKAQDSYNFNILSDVPFKNGIDNIEKFKTSFDVMNWSREITQKIYEIINIKNIQEDFIFSVNIYNKEKTRFVKVPIYVKKNIIEILKSKNPDNRLIGRFTYDNYRWILRLM
ncbi:MAG: hypothetical protein VXY18_05150 [Bacteroidota bacterium]|nr:hypothetical protein [Bacteroidota bacterium]|tara:strand:+ start:312 stop:704 length:393 start_codon:yes stop_codon:yes gene_type:complete